MDAPLDCVLLECGHIASCVNCGKQLAECPICRQYVVRVVRIFKAWLKTNNSMCQYVWIVVVGDPIMAEMLILWLIRLSISYKLWDINVN